MTTVDLKDTEVLSSQVVEILAKAQSEIAELGLTIKEVELRGVDALAGKVTILVKGTDEQFGVAISRKAPKKVANKFFDKVGVRLETKPTEPKTDDE